MRDDKKMGVEEPKRDSGKAAMSVAPRWQRIRNWALGKNRSPRGPKPMAMPDADVCAMEIPECPPPGSPPPMV